MIKTQIPEKHLSRVIDEVVEGIKMEHLEVYYPGGGSPAYHPKGLIKSWIYGYSEGVYTSRGLAKAIRERIPFMWLAGMQQPCFKTLNNFRSGRLKAMLDEIFVEVLLYLVEQGYIDLENCFTDGTKLEANGNRYKVVWAKNTMRYKMGVEERIRALLVHIDQLNEEENTHYGSSDLAEMGQASSGGPGSEPLSHLSERINEQVEQLGKAIAEKEKVLKKKKKKEEVQGPTLSEVASSQVSEQGVPVEASAPDADREPTTTESSNSQEPAVAQNRVDSQELVHLWIILNARVEALQAQQLSKADRRAVRRYAKACRDFAKEIEKLKKYEEQERILNGRNSYSKTDLEATFMRLKDDLLRAAYNLQYSTENQYIINFSVHQNANDGVTYPEHMDLLEQRLQSLAQRQSREKKNIDKALADSAYGNEQNYDYLDKGDINSFLKYPSFNREISGKPAGAFHRSSFRFNDQGNYWRCPQDRKLIWVKSYVETTATGYEKHMEQYQCQDCSDCAFAQQCKKGAGNRTISYSPVLENYKQQAKQNLCSEEGEELRKRRGMEVETPFGDIKYNRNYRRFILRGLQNVYTESGLLAIAYNLRKVYCEKSGIWAEYYAQRKRKLV